MYLNYIFFIFSCLIRSGRMHLFCVAVLVLGALTVSYADDNLDSHEVLKRLLSALTEKKEEKPVHRSLWDELEEELTKRKEVVNNLFFLFGPNFGRIHINQ